MAKHSVAIGDRVVFSADPSDRVDGHEVAGEVVDIIHNRAIIRPDDLVDGPATVVVTARMLKDIRKETTDG